MGRVIIDVPRAMTKTLQHLIILTFIYRSISYFRATGHNFLLSMMGLVLKFVENKTLRQLKAVHTHPHPPTPSNIMTYTPIHTHPHPPTPPLHPSTPTHTPPYPYTPTHTQPYYDIYTHPHPSAPTFPTSSLLYNKIFALDADSDPRT